ncbi:MAG TPA: phosphoribosylanthranilate isomerase [Dehalococcoidia bacterium]|jgi:phosphoribosylanthranilate isomerase|nr:phosphoribosylanthranilate isomerase [Dehalococcoidia bacterium]
MTRVKICGNRTSEDVIAAAEAGADFVGMIFARSSRQIGTRDARAMVDALGGPLNGDQREPNPEARGDVQRWFKHGSEVLAMRLEGKRPLTVGVFADQPIDEVNALVAEAGVDLVQLSGDESWEDCLRVERSVIQVVHVSPLDSPSDPMEFVEPGFAILLMLDAAHGPYRGGGGKPFDWEVAQQVASRIPMMLAGGLNPDNVGEAIERVRPWAVDVAGGTERDGHKDHALVRDFIEAVRAADGTEVAR